MLLSPKLRPLFALRFIVDVTYNIVWSHWQCVDIVVVMFVVDVLCCAVAVKEKTAEEVAKFQEALGGVAKKAKKKGWFW